MLDRTRAYAGALRRARFMTLLALLAGTGFLTAFTPVRAGTGVPDVPASPLPLAVLDATLEPLRGTVSAADAYTPSPAPFRLTVDGRALVHSVEAVSVLPGSSLVLDAEGGSLEGYELRHDAGAIEAFATGWRWTAPVAPGIHALEVTGEGKAVHLNVLVLHPRAHVEGDALHGFRIGRYAEKPLGGRSVYLPPEGFVQVEPEDEKVLVSPHFTLGQFLSKQAGEPRFVAFSPALVQKLEAVLAAVNEAGVATGTFHVMSGFRTPWYNRAIGNTTIYSRHLWGDAADIFVDRDGNGDMDDLNGDGRRDVSDARLLAGIVDQVEARGGQAVLPGGVGIYRRNAAHGPFVHVDARGYAARW